jgi:transcriptional regulator with XRE-family HTH domain
MKDRIITLIKAMNLTAAQFADEIKVQKSGISHIISGRNNPSLEFVNKILLRFPEVNMEWLMMGKGPMIKGDSIRTAVPESTLFTLPAEENKTPDLFTFEFSNSGEVKQNEIEDEIVNEPVPKEVEKKLDVEMTKRSVQENNSSMVNPPITQPMGHKKKIERILFFYTDNTFKEYIPEG